MTLVGESTIKPILGDVLTQAKLMFKKCDQIKYAETLKEKLKAHIPSLAKNYKAIEATHIEGSDNVNDGELLCLAQNIHKKLQSFDEDEIWFGSLEAAQKKIDSTGPKRRKLI